MKMSANDVPSKRRNKWLVLLGVAMGWVAVAPVDQVHAVQEDEYTIGTRFFQVVSTAPRDETSSDGVVSYGLRRDDFSRINETPTVEFCLPWRQMNVEVTSADKQRSMVVSGVSADWGAARGIEIERGRFLSEVDARTNGNVVVISQRAVDIFFPVEDPIGRTLMLGENHFIVVGVFETQDEDRDEEDGQDLDIHQLECKVDVFVPITAMRRRFGDQVIERTEGTFSANSYELSGILLRVKEREHYAATKEIVRKILLTDDEERSDFEIK